MSSTPAAGPLLPPSREWTVADLESLPDDGLRYELLDGILIVTPAPVPVHQRAVLEVAVALRAACPASMEVFIAPLDWQPDSVTSLQPDVLVAYKDHIGPKNLTKPLVLAVEILSPSTRRYDLLSKRAKYEDSGVQHFWVIDPAVPSFIAFDLMDGHFEKTAEVRGTSKARLHQPFPVEITPTALITR